MQENILSTSNSRFQADYKDCIVVFLDLMGIRNFTLTKEDSALFDVYSILDNYINFIPDVTLDTTLDRSRHFDSQVNLKDIFQDTLIITSLSDSIIISIRKEYLILLPYIIRLATNLQLFLLTRALPLRGGITSGKIFHKRNDPITMGKGLVEAAKLEKEAKFARVLIDDNLLTEYESIYRCSTKMERTLSFFKEHYSRMIGFDGFFEVSQWITKTSIIKDFTGKTVTNFLTNSSITAYNEISGLDFNNQFNVHIQAIRDKYKTTKIPSELDIIKKWEYLEKILESQTKSIT